MAVKPKSKSSNKPVGPFSRDRRLVNETIDRRSKVGRLFRTTIADLSDQIGSPTTAQALIIQSAALKSCRLFLLSEKLIGGGEIADGSDAHALAWLNSLRLDLVALGLERRIKDIGPSLHEILREEAAREAAEVAQEAPASSAATPMPLDLFGPLSDDPAHVSEAAE